VRRLHRHAYRTDSVARVMAHSELVKSREFTHVITARIQERKPDIPRCMSCWTRFSLTTIW
jgi:hypothetical protein